MQTSTPRDRSMPGATSDGTTPSDVSRKAARSAIDAAASAAFLNLFCVIGTPRCRATMPKLKRSREASCAIGVTSFAVIDKGRCRIMPRETCGLPGASELVAHEVVEQCRGDYHLGDTAEPKLSRQILQIRDFRSKA